MSVYIDKQVCKGCGLCVTSCPVGVFEMGTETNQKGFIVASVVNEEKCIGCKKCELYCPDLAIYVEE